MLFLLTGDVQIGKTRWLERLAAELAGDGVPVAGVLAAGTIAEVSECEQATWNMTTTVEQIFRLIKTLKH